MTAADELLLETRFLLNMGRIYGLVHLLYADEALKPTELFRSEGARADILRSIVVFLHATFEVVLRSQFPKPNMSLSFYSSSDLDKALKLSGIDAKPFKPLYPPLTQMAKRRKRIVHQADLSKPTDIVSQAWGVVDDWQLIMWLLAVPAFYYQLRASAKTASDVALGLCKRYRKAMLRHIDFGHQLRAFPQVPPELQKEALQRIVMTLESVAAQLTLAVRSGS